jgi:hypothetical protein
MPKITCVSVAVLALVGAALAARPATSPTPAFTQDAQIKVELETRLDTRKATVGFRVVAKVDEDIKVDGKVVLPKNSLLIGKITQVKEAASHTDAAVLGILFSQATDKKGNPLFPFRGAIAKILPATGPSEQDMLSRGPEMGGGNAAVMGDGGDPRFIGLDQSSNGIPVQYNLRTGAAGAQDAGGTITSVGGNFNIDEGTHLEIQVLN